MNDHTRNVTGAIIGFAVAFFVCLYMLGSCMDCEARGGAYVETTLGYECVEKR